jgi:hypothetical protein
MSLSLNTCASWGIAVTGVLTSSAIAQLSDHALEARVDGVNRYCRVNPAQKNRIVLALKKRGRVDSVARFAARSVDWLSGWVGRNFGQLGAELRVTGDLAALIVT